MFLGDLQLKRRQGETHRPAKGFSRSLQFPQGSFYVITCLSLCLLSFNAGGVSDSRPLIFVTMERLVTLLFMHFRNGNRWSPAGSLNLTLKMDDSFPPWCQTKECSCLCCCRQALPVPLMLWHAEEPAGAVLWLLNLLSPKQAKALKFL